MRRRHFSASFLFLFLLTSCSGWTSPPVSLPGTPPYVLVTQNPNASPTPTPFQPAGAASLTPLSSPTWTPSLPPPTSTFPPPTLPPDTPLPPPTIPPVTPLPGIRTQYTLAVALNYAAHWLSVDETITYPNQSGGSLFSLILAVEPNRWAGCFMLTSISVDGQPSTGHVLSGGWLEVPLAAPLANGSVATLSIQYNLYLPWAGEDQIFGYNSRQLNAVDWYPFVVPYIPGQGWLMHEPTVVGEHLVYDVADFDVAIQLADSAPGVVIAASAPADGNRYRLYGARNFVFSASSSFLTSTATAGTVTVTSYYFSGEYQAGAAILEQVTKAIGTYSDRFAPYPYSSLSIVEAVYQDGMEYSGLFFLSRDFYLSYDGTVLNNLITIGVHEAAHNWWYGLVGNDQALEPWLDEALSTYSELVFYESNYPNKASAWWGFRVNAFNPTGWVDATIYNGGAFRPYTNAVYLRGARFLHALRARVGDETFFTFLKDYAAQMSYHRAASADFFTILRQHTDANFSDLVAAYFQYPH